MKLSQLILRQKRLILTTVVLFTLTGLFAALTMPRQEDPRMPYRSAQLVVELPGADARTVERTIVSHIEEEVAEVPEVDEIESTATTNAAIFTFYLADTVYEVDSAWDDVRDAIDRAYDSLPESASDPDFDDRIFDVESIVFAITGSNDPLKLSDAADDLKRDLVGVQGVERVIISGAPEEEVRVELDEAALRAAGVTANDVTSILQARNTLIPGGNVESGGKNIILRPDTQFDTIEELAATPIPLANGTSIPLDALASVRRAPVQPDTEILRRNGELTVTLGVVPRPGIDVTAFGEHVRDKVEEVEANYQPLDIEEFFFQPTYVEKRLRGLGTSLGLGVLIVAAIVFFFMGPRLGMVVALIVPTVGATSLAVYALGGGILHQMSISSLVISLGLLVDNAIVVGEHIQFSVDKGMERNRAAALAIDELGLPLAMATGTTLAAFLPMLLSKGVTGDFTRAIPTVIMITLSISWVFAMTVTPTLSTWLLKPRKSAGKEGLLSRIGGRIANFTNKQPAVVLVLIGFLLAGAIFGADSLRQQFFPTSDRSMVIVRMELPEGTTIRNTEDRTQWLEEQLRETENVTGVLSAVGRELPHFYYNLVGIPLQSNFAQIAVETTSVEANDTVIELARELGTDEYPEMTIVTRKLEQGPPVVAPVEIQLLGNDLDALHESAEQVLAALRATEGTVDARHDMGNGTPVVDISVADAVASNYGIFRSDLASATLRHANGVAITEYRGGRDPTPVKLHGGDDNTADELESIDVVGRAGFPVPLSEFAELNIGWEPASIRHYQRQRVVSVTAGLENGLTFTDIQGDLQNRLDKLELPGGVDIHFGGDVESSGEANNALLKSLPPGILLLIFFIMVEFNSFRRLGIILLTIPLAATGIVPGLLLSGEPFGFMSLLGVFALIGIVVNNGIVLIDVMDRRLKEGVTRNEAISDAVQQRIRPILLTTATTVSGLLPLALSKSPLWPPMAWAMIAGLLASTVLTLVAIPALYRLLIGEDPVLSDPFSQTPEAAQ